MIWLYILFIGLILIFLMAPSFDKRALYQRFYAHRGLHSEDLALVENSLSAFAGSMKDGYGMELDVRLSSDDEVMVYHDDNLKRLHRVDQSINTLTKDELKAYGIPTLLETLDLIDGKVGLIIELKADKDRDKLSELTYNILKSYEKDYVVESFDPRIVRWFKKNAPEVTRGQLIMPVKNYENKALGILINSLLYNFLTRPHFLAMNVDNSKAHPAMWVNKLLGVKIVLWTVKKEHVYHKKHVDAVIFESFRPTSRN